MKKKSKRQEITEDLAAWFILYAESHYNRDDAKCKMILDHVQKMLEEGIELPIAVADKMEILRLNLMSPMGIDPH